jgi:cysteine desulfurase
VTNVAEWLKKTGQIEWTELAVENDGRINPKALESALRPNTVLVSIMHGNNEIATIQDIAVLGAICRARDVLFHADACQTFCHTPFSVRNLPVDFMSLSGHKIRAPKGVGAVYIRNSLQLTPLLFGGKQERGLRPGTTSVELICAFATATELWNVGVIDRMHHVRRYAIDQLKKTNEGLRINGCETGPTLCHVLSFTISGVHSKDIHRELANVGVACSTGSACGTGKSDSSQVLLGLGRDVKDAHQIRISFSPSTDLATIDVFVDRLTKVLRTLATK